jgi:hypothetical protein
MISLIGSVLTQAGLAPATGSRGKMAKAMPPVAFGGSIAAGIVSMMISGHKIVDCIRYQTSAGQCDTVIETNLPGVVAGGGVLAGCWGAFNTYNPRLRKSENIDQVAAKELVVPTEPEKEVEQEANSLLIDRVVEKRQAGSTQKEIAESLGISIYEVRKALYQARLADRGR